MYVVGLRDRSSIVVNGLVAPICADDQGPDSGTLGAPVEVMAWVGEAVAAGVTFDILKEISTGFVRRGWTRRTRHVDAGGITVIVREYLESTGYLTVNVKEVRKIADAGWSVSGTANGSNFRALSDLLGEVTHVRVD